jgi:hypothetical protein
MEQINKSSNECVIGVQCMRQTINDNRIYESYTKEQKKEKDTEDIQQSHYTTPCCFSSEKEKEEPNNIIKEKSDSNAPFIMNNKELKNCKTSEETIKVLTNFMQEGFDDFKNRTGRNPSYSEMRAMYG